jgi:hypothetical protein
VILPLTLSLTLFVGIPVDTLHVSDPLLGSPSLRLGTDTVDTYVINAGDRRFIGVFVQTIRETSDGYLVIQRNERPSGELLSLDTIALERGSLATQWHGDVTRAGWRHVAFANGRMRGILVDSAGASHVIDEAVPDAHFDYSVYGLITNQLPLAGLDHVVLATYDIARGPQYVPLAILGPESLDWKGESVQAWRLDTELAPGWMVSRWVEAKGRRELRWLVKSGSREMIGEVR